MAEYQNPIKSGKVNWSEPRHKEGPFGQTHEVHLQNSVSKEPIRNRNTLYGDDKIFSVGMGGKQASLLGPKDIEQDKAVKERDFVRNDVSKYASNIFNSSNMTDEAKIDFVKDIAGKEGLNDNDVTMILREQGLSPRHDTFSGTQNKLFNAIGGFEGQELGNLPDQLAQDFYLTAYRSGNAKPKNWYRDQINRAMDYVKSLERNNVALSGGKYYPDNEWREKFYGMLGKISRGEDIKGDIVPKEAKGDNFWSDNDWAYESHETDWEGPQKDLDDTVRRNTEPGKYRDIMDAKKKASNLESQAEEAFKTPYDKRTPEQNKIIGEWLDQLGLASPIKTW